MKETLHKLLKFIRNYCLELILIGFAIILICTLVKNNYEMFTDPPLELPVDADNPNMTDIDVWGQIAQTASAGIYKKKQQQVFAANIDSKPITGGGINYTETVPTFDTDLNDIEYIINAAADAAAVTYAAATAAVLQTQIQKAVSGKIQDKVKTVALQTKTGQTITKYTTKAVTAVTQRVSAAMQGKFGGSLVNKLMTKIATRISEELGKKAAVAASTAGAVSAIPFGQVLAVILTALSVTAITLQTTVTVLLKGEPGFCPAGYTLLDTQIPQFLNSIPGIGDILGCMGPYLCYRDGCDANEDDNGAGLCYPKCDPGYNGLATTCWAQSNPSTASAPPKLGCAELNQGWARCRDDGTSLWEDWQCNTSCPGGGPWYNIANCRTECNGCGCIKKTLMQRQICPAGKELAHTISDIDQQCYTLCPSSTPNRVPGVPTQCSVARFIGVGKGGSSYDRGAGKPKLKMIPVSPNPAPPPPPPATTAAAFSDGSAVCNQDFTATGNLSAMCKFYFLTAAAQQVPNASGNITVPYISKIVKLTLSSQRSCDITCEMTSITYNKTTNTKVSWGAGVPTTTGHDRRFYFAKVSRLCGVVGRYPYVPTAVTNKNGFAPDVYLTDPGSVLVNYTWQILSLPWPIV